MADTQIQIDLTGINPFDPTSFEDPPAGPHEVEIISAEQNDTGKKAYKFGVKLPSGMTTDVYVGSDFSKDGNKKSLKALLVGMLQAAGKPAEAANGKISMPISAFVGKRAYVFVRTYEGETQVIKDNTTGAEREVPKRADKNFITKDLFEKLKAAGVGAASTANGAAAPATAGAPAPAGGSSLGNLFGA